MNTGRFWIRDWKTGRTFCVEPISERNQKITGVMFTNGGISGDEVKWHGESQGGSIAPEDSIITKENGFVNIMEFQGSPNSIVEELLKK